jgi:tripartite-type tricarboxylate transporter receptor subunit TctC
MFRGFKIAAFLFLLAVPAYAQKPVEIVSGIPVVGSGGQIGLGIANILNDVQKEREYRFSAVQGAQGDTALLRAATLSRNGADIIYYGGISSVTFNRVQNPTPGFDRDNDFVLSYGIGKNVLGILVNPKAGIENVDDLVKFVKSKPKAYFATTLTAPASIMMNDIFMKKYGLTNIKLFQKLLLL